MKTRIFLSLLLLLFLFVIAGIPRFLSLDAHWSSDEARWIHRYDPGWLFYPFVLTIPRELEHVVQLNGVDYVWINQVLSSHTHAAPTDN